MMNILKRDSRKEGEIWVIGGGKGGSGKTFFTSNVGTYLAKKGEKVILVDADFGGANLHSFIGLNRPQYCLSNHFESNVPLEDILTETPLANMELLVGDIHSLSPDNIRFNQKLKLYRSISQLKAQYILIDVGAGSHRDTIDTFLLADRMIIVCEPDVISIENMYQFVKNALYRKLKWALRPNMTPEVLQYFRGRPGGEKAPIRNLRELIGYLRGIPGLQETIDREVENFKINLILNKTRSAQDIQMGSTIKSFLLKYLGIKTKYTGFVEYDDIVWKSVRQRQILLLAHPDSRCAKEIRTSVENIIMESELRFV